MAEASKVKVQPKEVYKAPTVEKMDASATVKVINISSMNVCLASGVLEVNQEGEATVAEASTLSDYIKIIGK
jgi:hypothetical protein